MNRTAESEANFTVVCVGNSAHDHVLTNAMKQLDTFPLVG